MSGGSSRFSQKEVADLQKCFNTFDKDKSGTISTKELSAVMQAMGQNFTDQQVQDMIKFADRDGTGTVNFDEFLKMMEARYKEPTSEEDLLLAFRAFDKDGNGYITPQELHFAMGQLGERLTADEAKRMMKAADKNNDGRIDYKEFAAMIMK